ncbi:MAG: hypothetical protein RR461_04935 [Angelakisella sp.]
MKHFFAIVLAAVCCMALSVPALAQGMEPITPYFTHIKSAKGNMTISSSGTAKVTGGMSIAKGDTCEIIATIEQEIDGSWQEVKTFTVSADRTSTTISKSKALYKGYSYRCVFQFNVYEGGTLMESYEAITDEKWY